MTLLLYETSILLVRLCLWFCQIDNPISCGKFDDITKSIPCFKAFIWLLCLCPCLKERKKTRKTLPLMMCLSEGQRNTRLDLIFNTVKSVTFTCFVLKNRVGILCTPLYYTKLFDCMDAQIKSSSTICGIVGVL